MLLNPQVQVVQTVLAAVGEEEQNLRVKDPKTIAVLVEGEDAQMLSGPESSEDISI